MEQGKKSGSTCQFRPGTLGKEGLLQMHTAWQVFGFEEAARFEGRQILIPSRAKSNQTHKEAELDARD